MILPEVNVLVQTFRADTPEHGSWNRSMREAATESRRRCSAASFASRLIRDFAQPSRLDEALRFANTLLGHVRCMIVQPGERHWNVFTRLCTQADARGNLVPDAWFAALAIESGCEWITLDRDYARFPGLRWRVPG